jgi:hypothetical protein
MGLDAGGNRLRERAQFEPRSRLHAVLSGPGFHIARPEGDTRIAELYLTVVAILSGINSVHAGLSENAGKARAKGSLHAPSMLLSQDAGSAFLRIDRQVGCIHAESRQHGGFRNIRSLQDPDAVARMDPHLPVRMIRRPDFGAASTQIVPHLQANVKGTSEGDRTSRAISGGNEAGILSRSIRLSYSLKKIERSGRRTHPERSGNRFRPPLRRQGDAGNSSGADADQIADFVVPIGCTRQTS